MTNMNQHEQTIAHALIGEMAKSEDLDGFVRGSVPSVFFRKLVDDIKAALNKAWYHDGEIHYTLLPRGPYDSFQNYGMGLYMYFSGIDPERAGGLGVSKFIKDRAEGIQGIVNPILFENKHSVRWGASKIHKYEPDGIRVVLNVVGYMQFPIDAADGFYVEAEL